MCLMYNLSRYPAYPPICCVKRRILHARHYDLQHRFHEEASFVADANICHQHIRSCPRTCLRPLSLRNRELKTSQLSPFSYPVFVRLSRHALLRSIVTCGAIQLISSDSRCSYTTYTYTSGAGKLSSTIKLMGFLRRLRTGQLDEALRETCTSRRV